MAKITLVAAPTFNWPVPIPVAGGESVPVEFTFRHRTKTQLDEFIKSRAEKSDVDSFLDMVVAWPGFVEEFNRENVELLLQNHIGTALQTYHIYVTELLGARLKNSAR